MDYGAGGGAQALALADDHSFALAHRYALAGTYVAAVTVHAGGASGTRRFVVTVRNVAPHIAVQSSGAARRGIAFRRRIVFTDPGADSWRAVITWGDGSQSLRPGSRSHSFVTAHIFRRAGLFTVTVRVSDHHGGTGVRRFKVRVRA